MGQGELNIKVRRLAADDLGDVSAIFGWYAVNSAGTQLKIRYSSHPV